MVRMQFGQNQDQWIFAYQWLVFPQTTSSHVSTTLWKHRKHVLFPYIHSGTVIRQRGMEELCRGLISDTQSQKRQNRTELCSYRLLSKKEQKIGSLFPSHQQASKIWLHQWGQGLEVLENENDCMTDLILSPDLQQSKLKVKAGLNRDGFHFFPKTYQLSEFMRTGKCCGIVSYRFAQLFQAFSSCYSPFVKIIMLQQFHVCLE